MVYFDDSSVCHQPCIMQNPCGPLQWRHNGHYGISKHQPHHCLLNHLFRRRSKKTSKLRVTGLRAGNSPVTGEFPTQRASNAENVSIWWHHHAWWDCQVINTLRTRQNGHCHFQTTFSNAFSCMKIIVFWFKFHWNLFPIIQLTINQQSVMA